MLSLPVSLPQWTCWQAGGQSSLQLQNETYHVTVSQCVTVRSGRSGRSVRVGKWGLGGSRSEIVRVVKREDEWQEQNQLG